MALEFIGGALFTVLYDGVKKAMSRNTKFKFLLGDLKYTLDSLQPRIIQQIEDHNVELGLPNDEIQDLKRQMEEGIKLVGKLSKVCMWKCCILYNCSNCMKPSYSEQLVELDRSLRRLLEMLKLQEARDVKEVLLLARKIHDKQDDLEKRLADLLKVQQESLDILRKQNEARDVHESSGSNTETTAHDQQNGGNMQQVVLFGRGGAVGSVFRVLFDVVIQAKDKTKMFKIPLDDLKSTLDSLEPLIQEMEENNKLLHLPKDEFETIRLQMEKGVELIHSCSIVREGAQYKKHEYTNKLRGLDEYLQTLLNKLRVQVLRDVKETLVSVSKIEAVIEQMEGSRMVQNDQSVPTSWCQVSEPPSLTVGFEVLNMQGTTDVKETLISVRDVGGVEGIEGSDVVENDLIESKSLCEVPEPPLPTIGLDGLYVQGKGNVKETLVSESDMGEGVKEVEDVSGLVQYDQMEISSCQTLVSESDMGAGVKEVEGGGVVQNDQIEISACVPKSPSPTVGFLEDEQKKTIQDIKKELEDPEQSDESLVELLQSLVDMEISFQELKEADIGRQVSHWQTQHASNAVRSLAEQVVSKWKGIVDECELFYEEQQELQNDHIDSKDPCLSPEPTSTSPIVGSESDVREGIKGHECSEVPEPPSLLDVLNSPRRKISEEVDQILRRSSSSLTIGPSLRIQALEPSSLCLVFAKSLALPIFVARKISDEDNNQIQILVVDKNMISSSHQMGPISLPHPVKVEIVVLDGDLPSGDGENWTSQEFNNNVLKGRTGKIRSLLTGDVNVTVRDGFATIGDIAFTDNSSWLRSRKFRLGARVAPGTGYQGPRIREALTDAFVVKDHDHRGQYLYKKHYPPKLEDEVWRLEKIGKDGAFHKRLAADKIHTVQDFLKMFVVDPLKLKKILGVGMSEKMWEATVKHATTCVTGNKMYIFRGPHFELFLTPICQLIKAVINGQTFTTRDLNNDNRNYIENLVRQAHANWNSLEVVDTMLNETDLLTLRVPSKYDVVDVDGSPHVAE